MKWYELRILADASSLPDVSNVVYATQQFGLGRIYSTQHFLVELVSTYFGTSFHPYSMVLLISVKQISISSFMLLCVKSPPTNNQMLRQFKINPKKDHSIR